MDFEQRFFTETDRIYEKLEEISCDLRKRDTRCVKNESVIYSLMESKTKQIDLYTAIFLVVLTALTTQLFTNWLK